MDDAAAGDGGAAEVDGLLAGCPEQVAATVLALRRVLLEGRPDLVEKVRSGWRSLNYHDPVAGFVCALFPQPDTVALVFEHGARLPDPYGVLTGDGRQVRSMTFARPDDVRPAVVLEYLDSAAEIGATLRAPTARPRCSM